MSCWVRYIAPQQFVKSPTMKVGAAPLSSWHVSRECMSPKWRLGSERTWRLRGSPTWHQWLHARIPGPNKNNPRSRKRVPSKYRPLSQEVLNYVFGRRNNSGICRLARLQVRHAGGADIFYTSIIMNVRSF